MAVEDEPKWLTLFRQSANPKEVVTTWHAGLNEADRQEAQDDPATARAKLRRAIVASECPEVRADAASGWKRTGAVLRAGDEVLGIKCKPARAFPAVPGSFPFRPKHVCKVDEPGKLGLWWSDFDTAIQAKRLRDDCGVTHRLNVGIEVISKFRDDGDEFVKTVHIPMEDSFALDEETNKDWPAQLAEALRLLRQWRDEGAVVNVNCQMGKNRSGAVVLMWLCCENGWELEAAVKHLRSITPLACGNPHLLAAMCEVLGVSDAKIPLNEAADGGGWVCISPPGSPRPGAAMEFDMGHSTGGVEEAASRLASMNEAAEALKSAGYSTDKPAEVEEVDEPAGNMEGLFSELSDVD